MVSFMAFHYKYSITTPILPNITHLYYFKISNIPHAHLRLTCIFLISILLKLVYDSFKIFMTTNPF
jgi:hypothetical protein